MAFQINEKMMASDRAIITRNKNDQDLLRTDIIKFKPGMMHYISENRKLWLSVDPKADSEGNTKALLEVMTDDRLNELLNDFVHRDGGNSYCMRGPLHSVVETGTAPLVISSTTKVENLNADLIDDMHVSIESEVSSIVGRDKLGNINVKHAVNFLQNKLEDNANAVHVKTLDGSTYTDICAGNINAMNGVVQLRGSERSCIEAHENETSNSKGSIEWKDNAWHAGIDGAVSEIITKSLYGHGKGIDADTVDGKHVDDTKNTDQYLWTAKKIDAAKAPRGFGLGTDVNSIKNNDCNDIVGTGFFSGVTPTNGVSGESGEAIIQSFISTNGQYQTIEYLDSKNIYSRIKKDTGWTNWIQTVTSNNILELGTNIILSKTQPTNIKNENTYWFEIIE